MKMNKLHRKTRIAYLKSYRNDSWLLNVYLIQSNKDEHIPDDVADELIETYIGNLEDMCISDEFDYFRTGFVFLHYGNRGVDLTVWHYGKWGQTFETYCCSWYCYNRATEKMELLDSAEPVICQYELLYIIDEMNALCSILKDLSTLEDDTFKSAYRDYYIKQATG